MKAWLLDRMGDGVDGLRLGEVPEPVAGPGQVVIDLQLAALNPADRYLAEDQYPAKPTFPHILGRDGLGTISRIGPGVEGHRVGEKVIVLSGDAGINRAGTLAQKMVAPIETLAPVPAGWTDEQAVAAPLVYCTAYQALSQFGALPANATLLISGASGGVGVACVQLGAALGYTVIALSRNATKAQTLRSIGAAITLDPTDANWKSGAKAYLKSLPPGADGKPHRVDLAVDSVGGPGFADLIELLGEHGRVSCVGRLAGPVPEFNTATLFFRRIRIGGVAVHSYTAIEARGAWTSVLQTLAKRDARPLVDSVFPMAELKGAFQQLEKGPMGKVLVTIVET